MLALWWVSFGGNTGVIKATERGFDNYAAAAAPLIKQTTVNDPDVRPVYELIGALPPLPYGYDNRDKATPLDGHVRAQRARPRAGSPRSPPIRRRWSG